MVNFTSNIPNMDLFVTEYSDGPKSLHAASVYTNPDTHDVEHNAKHFGTVHQGATFDYKSTVYTAPAIDNTDEATDALATVGQFVAGVAVDLSDGGFVIHYSPSTESGAANAVASRSSQVVSDPASDSATTSLDSGTATNFITVDFPKSGGLTSSTLSNRESASNSDDDSSSDVEDPEDSEEELLSANVFDDSTISNNLSSDSDRSNAEDPAENVSTAPEVPEAVSEVPEAAVPEVPEAAVPEVPEAAVPEVPEEPDVSDPVVIPSTQTITGTAGKDTLQGDPDTNDTIYGLGGKDKLHGDKGDDTLHGGAGKDELHGDEGDDTLHGDAGKDKLHGGEGDDTLHGGAGKDELHGDEGNDTLYGGTGKDELHGGEGDDTLHGGAGKDKLYGEGGHDKFLFGTGDGADSADGGAAGGWIDIIELRDITGGPSESLGDPGSWTLEITNAAVADVDAGLRTVTFDQEAQGTITLSDGSTLDFENIEGIVW